jgi:hypothetical protein
MAGTLTPERTARRLCELSADARAAVLLDAAVDRAHRDIPGGPPEQVEAQVDGGTVYASRTPRWTLAVVARRNALSSLMLMDLRAVLGELQEGHTIRRSTAAEAAGAAGPATDQAAASESPVPELGVDE